MGRGINTETTKADRWAYGSIAQYRHILTTDTNPLTVYVLNTSTGFHPPHHETVYRSDDGGKNWHATYFQDTRFKQYNIAPNYITASAGQSFKSGDTPFGAAICNSDPDRLILVWSQSYITHDGGDTWKQIGRQGRQTFGGYFYPKHDEWIYMTLTEGAPGAGLWLSRDNGQTWQPFDDLPFSNIQRVTFDPSNDTLMYVTTFGGSVWRGPVVPHVVDVGSADN